MGSMGILAGFDVGSVIAKAVLLDERARIVGRWETRSRGRPAEALHTLLEKCLKRAGRTELRIGLTGYGREGLAFPEAVYACNEIAALAYGVSHLDRRIKSAIEVGGQSTQWIRLEGEPVDSAPGRFLDFVVNERCAAGSGAFIEQQAARLKLNIEESSKLTTRAKTGAPIAGRCSVFAKSDMIHLQQKGSPVEEIAYGLCQAVARNFIGTILKGKEVVPPVLFAGGGARNEGLVRAFRDVLDLEQEQFIPSPCPSYECALGAALAAREFGRDILISASEDSAGLFIPEEKRTNGGLVPLSPLSNSPDLEPRPSAGEMIRGYLGLDVG